MPPLPKKKHSKKRQGGRSAHNSLKPMASSECPQCHNLKLPHHVCSSCGYYNGVEVIPTTGDQ